MTSCSVCVKTLVKVGLSEGGSVQLDFFLKGKFCHECYFEKNIVFSMRVLNLSQDLFVSCLKVFVGVGTKDKPLVRTDILSSVNM